MPGLIVRRRYGRIKHIEVCRLPEVRRCSRAARLAAVFRVGPGIAQVHAEAAGIGKQAALEVLRQDDRSNMAFEAAGIGQHVLVFTARVEAHVSNAVPHTWRDIGCIAAGDQRIDRRINRTTISKQAVVPNPSIQRIGQIDPVHRIAELRVDVVEVQVPV